MAILKSRSTTHRNLGNALEIVPKHHPVGTTTSTDLHYMYLISTG